MFGSLEPSCFLRPTYSFFMFTLFLIILKVALCPRSLGTLELEVKLSRKENICSALLTGPNHCGELYNYKKAPWIGYFKTYISGLALRITRPRKSF